MTGLAARYAALIEAGELKPDAQQAAAVATLADLQDRLEATCAERGFIARLLDRKPDRTRGAYLWGAVGRGKSMLMDLFFETLRIERKRRVHFHAFMLDVHAALKTARQTEQGDPVNAVAGDIAKGVRLLAFDEMVINNSADAMIISRLFTALLGQGVTVVATSNRPPRDLYKDGLNREHFLPFIATIEAENDIIALNGPTDYRRDRLGDASLWHVPNGPAATTALSEAFFRLTDYPPSDKAHVPSCELAVGGKRTLHVPKALKGVAVFSFKRLCGEARGASDYLAIARTFHAVIIVGIPVMGPDMRNEAARFVTLIDALYEYRVKLLASADAEPDGLYPAGDGRFEFDRTVSRLLEMRSEAYLALGHGVGDDVG
ncbi:AFG1 family ATPase [Sphingorhabdus soli]|uniref:AFG1 family ATPase n=1 Tax=Flavisphingopyxis soli TaxID=2601267 RepID=A0A5C6U4F8_9SPHN|nr:cell division protein ZapE [Sphingorhabdus soli]TXC67784.1 AFG1 family ATPase [Sphingorhabdus soli]